MRRRILTLLLLSSIGSRALAQELLTFQDSVDRAVKSNPRLLVAQEDVSIARTSVSQAKSLFYPTVNLNANYVRYRNETLGITSPELGNIVLEAPIPNDNGTRGNPLADDLYLGRLGFRQTIYAGGRIESTYQLSKANLERAKSSFAATREEVKQAVAKSFYTLLGLKHKEELTRGALSELAKLKTDMASITAQASLRQSLFSIQKEIRETRYDYLQAMGVELFNDVDVTGTLEVAPTQLDLQKALAWAKQNRTELKESQLQEEVDRLAVSLSMAERYPVFLLGGGYELRNNDFPLNNANWNTVLSMTIPIFDGFSSWARVKASRYRAEQGRYRHVQLEDQIEREVRSSFEDFHFWMDELPRRQQDADRFKQMNGTSLSLPDHVALIDAQLKTKLDVIDAQVQLCLANAALEKSIGRPREDQGR